MKPSIPKGTRDFAPEEMARRQYIFTTIRSVFQRYGYQQIETPAMENLSTLMGKYGEEGDKLLFKILNSGDWLGSLSLRQAQEQDLTIGKATTAVSEKGLRYDLTVPFARFVVQHRDQLQMPFRRYQIQPVWRADRPQKGRYREFYQCDVDVVGTNSLLSELELIEIVQEVYRRFGIRVSLHINNRKILAGISEVIGDEEKLVAMTVAIDKLDKIGIDNVVAELTNAGISSDAISTVLVPILTMTGSNQDKIATLRQLLAKSEVGMRGVDELETIFSLCHDADIKDNDSFLIEFDPTLARGLNYYTGAIFEVKALDVQMGSITGGGRYDNLTGIFGMPGLSGVGISFGADRIYDVLNELNLYPEATDNQTQALFVSFGEEEQRYALRWASLFRSKGINTEVYPDLAKMKKQMTYADQKHIPFVAIVGSDEMQHSTITLKNMLTGTQYEVNQDEAIALIASALTHNSTDASKTESTSTEQFFDTITARCREVYQAKMQDYGPSWRIMRPQTVNDQLFIKAMRIREIETTGVNLVGESVEGELMAIVNYSIIGLIQLLHGYSDSIDMTAEEALALYDQYLAQARALMLRKNHDYGEAWRDMQTSSLTDIILTKINRNKSIAANDNQTLISEGADGNYFDMLNYAIFSLIKHLNP